MMGLRSLKDTVAGSHRGDGGVAPGPVRPGPHFLLGAVAAADENDWEQAAEHFVLATWEHRSQSRRTGPMPASTCSHWDVLQKQWFRWSERSCVIR
jgi:hypothetical protein